MARTIYFNDGSREVLLGDDTVEELRRIVRERLGRDTEQLLCDMLEEAKLQGRLEAEWAEKEAGND